MANKRNYAKELNTLIETFTHEEKRPTLLLHACCAPCSSAVLEKLTAHFKITVLFYNPNIYPSDEYEERLGEIRRLVREMPSGYPVEFVAGDYRPEEFFQMAKGHEEDEEGGERCTLCFRMRLYEAAKLAKEGGFDWFTTTLTISPMKDAARLNRIGEEAGEKYGARFLNSDFKKKNGYRRSVELSQEYHLYRQNYCGCVYSRRDAASRENQSGGCQNGNRQND